MRLLNGVALAVFFVLGSQAEAFAQEGPEATPFRFELVSSAGFINDDLTKLTDAIAKAEDVFNTVEFRERILEYKYQGRRQFADNDGLTNQQIYARIMAAKETYDSANGRNDRIGQLSLNLYTPPFWNRWGTVGYTYPDQPDVYMNSYYFRSFSPAEVANNVVHEWLHKIGFEHDFEETEKRPFSVPYAVGDLVEELAD